MGYEKPSTKLTFYKAFFSPQWKFLIHSILQCMNAKRTSWNEFSSSMASAVICLSTGRKFNFSKYLFDSLMRNMDSSTMFYMVGKGFSRVDTPLFEGMIVAQQADDVADEGVTDVDVDVVLPTADEPSIPSPTPTTQPPPPSQELPSTSQDVAAVAKEVEVEKTAKIEENADVQGRQAESQAQIYHINLEHADKVLSMQDDEVEPVELKEVVEVDEAYARELEAKLNKTINWDDLIDQMQRKEKEDNANTKEQLEEEESRALKRKTKSQAEKSAKKQKLDEEVKELKKHLQIVPNDDDDDVYTKATPLASKVPVVDYEIYTENNKPYYKIIRDDLAGREKISTNKVNLENVYNLDMDHEETILSMQDVTDADSKEVAKEMVEIITLLRLLLMKLVLLVVNLMLLMKNQLVLLLQTLLLLNQVKDKGKAKLVEEPKVLKSRKTQIAIDEEVARRIETEWNADMKWNIDWNKVVEQVQSRQSDDEGLKMDTERIKAPRKEKVEKDQTVKKKKDSVMSSNSASSKPDSPKGASASPDYVPGPKEPEHASLSPYYLPGPKYPEYLALSDEEILIEYQPYVVADSPIALSSGYVADSDPEEDPKEDPEEDHADFPADRGDDADDDDDDDDEEPFKDEDDDEDEEHLALADSPVVPVINPVSSAEDIEAFEIDEATPILVPSPRRHTARISVRPQTPVPWPSEAKVERHLALPILPSSPLTPLSSLLPQIPSPPLLHVPTSLPLSLSPLPPLPASLSIPSQVDRREDTSEAKLPPRKRLCLTALTSRYEVGESLTDAPRPTGGHRVNYGFINTMDAKVRRQRAEEVGYGIRDVWGQLSVALGQIKTLQARGQTHANDHKGAAGTVVGFVFFSFISDNHNNMPPKRTFDAARAAVAAATPMIPAAVKRLIKPRVSAVLANHEALRNSTNGQGDGSHNSDIGTRGTVRTLRECTYKDFLNCKLLTFKGTERVVVLTQWFEKMESLFHISNCVVENQVKFATCTFLGNALTWWNSHIKAVIQDVAYAMDWKTLRKMMTDKYCPRDEIKKMFHKESKVVEKDVGGLPDMIWGNVMSYQPKTMAKAIEFANDQMDQKVLTISERQAEQKRKMELNGHFKKDCPKLKNGNHGNQRRNVNAPAKFYVVVNARTNLDSSVIKGTFLLNNLYASILFDTGADRSFISTIFNSLIDITSTTLDHYYDVELADRKIIRINTIIRGCTLNFVNHPFNINLMPMELGSFDVIIGMDWLSKYHAVIDCSEKIVRIPWGNETLLAYGDGSN
uniref:Reverse transcriptase domain-containing protein n=1 Tax=Tanacetum cinerariifolium TaxID=118510 RepID=A0A6L2P407_TANCI|nr:reverse transcriptase domain-containing protein [Tanacetum cinerariifolium]